MKYGIELKHSNCDTCRECAKSAITGAKLTNAVEASSYIDNCGATAFEETEEDYAAVWA